MSRDPYHVLIAGGGAAALEALLALGELAGDRVHVTLLAPERHFLYRPVTVGEAFERSQAPMFSLAGIAAHRRADVVRDSLARVDPEDHRVTTGSGRRLSYDSLIVATGAIPREPLPGALTFRGRRDVPALRELLDELVHGHVRSLALTLPSERMWPLPLYELALMSAAYLRERDLGFPVWLVTPEDEPLSLFGPAAAQAIMPLLRARNIRLRTSSRPAYLRRRMLVLAGGGEIPTERVITLPELEGPFVPGLPHDEHGFIPIDDHCRVPGSADVYAAGDVTTFPLKQGGLAAQQADAAAEAIAAGLDLPIVAQPFRPVLRGLLMTTGAPLYLRAEPQRLDRQATVAIEARPRRRSGQKRASAAAGEPLWWPPAKIAGRYLGPFLATARPQPLGAEPLVDRLAGSDTSTSASAEEQAEALELALLLADCDARWGDFAAALSALDAAQALSGFLPPEYEVKRRKWLDAAQAG